MYHERPLVVSTCNYCLLWFCHLYVKGSGVWRVLKTTSSRQTECSGCFIVLPGSADSAPSQKSDKSSHVSSSKASVGFPPSDSVLLSQCSLGGQNQTVSSAVVRSKPASARQHFLIDCLVLNFKSVLRCFSCYALAPPRGKVSSRHSTRKCFCWAVKHLEKSL